MIRKMGESSPIALVAFLVLFFPSQVKSNGSDHRYKAQDPVPFYSNKLGPFNRPSETYPYYSLPYCSPDHMEEKKRSLGEVLNGDNLVSGPYKLEFLVNKDFETLCKKNLTKEEVSQFRAAIAQDYYTQMFYDDLPIWTFVGRVDNNYDTNVDDYRYRLFTNIVFDILYNEDRIIEANAEVSIYSFIDLTEDKEVEVEFLYSVRWKKTNVSFEDRMDKYVESSLIPYHLSIHWFSVINSCETLLLLAGFLVIFYFRVIKKDFNKFIDDEEFGENQQVKGWKNIHGDVFRYPKHKSLFAAAVGSGTQLIFLVLFIILLGVVGVFRPYSRGDVLTGLVVMYTITSCIAGYTALSLYSQLGGTNWVGNLLLTGSVFCGPLFITFCFLNTITATYGATATLSLRTILLLICIFLFGAFPLHVFGGIIGKNRASEFESPCRTTKCPREVPRQRWYKGIILQMVASGILPFGVIHVELYYLFASVWGHRTFTVYLILLVVAVFLLLVTALMTVTLTYSQLASENHKWWWRSFLYGGSTGLYLLGYSLNHYYYRSYMSGLMQTSFFFGYMACISYGLFLMLGSVGFYASLLFIRHIYGSIKCE